MLLVSSYKFLHSTINIEVKVLHENKQPCPQIFPLRKFCFQTVAAQGAVSSGWQHIRRCGGITLTADSTCHKNAYSLPNTDKDACFKLALTTFKQTSEQTVVN